MPISKAECTSRRNKAVASLLENLYKTIDAALLKDGHFRQDTATMLGVSDIDIKVNLLKQAYESQGWKVTRQEGYDQRDNDGWDYITIS